jgi:hypothetical protein
VHLKYGLIREVAFGLSGLKARGNYLDKCWIFTIYRKIIIIKDDTAALLDNLSSIYTTFNKS